MNRFTILLFISFLIITCNLKGQDTLRGRVLDQTTLEPLEFASIQGPSSKTGTISDQQGYFTLPHSAEIRISAVGYEAQSIMVGKEQTFVRIFMQPSSIQLQEVVVSAIPSDRDMLRESGAAISMLGKRELNRDRGALITPALNRVPGVFMHSGSLNTNRITIRGIGSRTPYGTNKIRAYLQDIPLTSGTGETSLEDIDLDFIERVEIIKGPSSSLYGAGLGGTILLYPAKPSVLKTRILQKNTFGSYGLIRNTTGVSHSGQYGHASLAYNRTHSDGYRENNQYDRSGFQILGEYFPGEKHTFTFLTQYTRVKAFIPSSLDSADYMNNPTAAAQSWKETRGVEDYNKLRSGLSYLAQINPDLDFKTAIFGGYRNNDEIRPFNILEERSRYAGARSYLRYQPDFGTIRSIFVMGGEYFYEYYTWRTFENLDRQKGSILSDNEEQRSYGNGFIQTTLKFTSGLTLHAGINFNKTRYDYTDHYTVNGDESGKYTFDIMFSPRMVVSYRFSEKFFIHAGASHGFSPPTLQETLTPEGEINPDIRPETGWNSELGIRGELYQKRLYYDVSVYSMQIRNLLVARRTAEDQFTGVNAGKTRHNGVEAELRMLVIDQQSFTVQLFANGTFTDYRFREFIEDSNDYSGNRLTGTPKNTMNAGLEVNANIGLYGTLNYNFVDAMPLRDDNSIFSQSFSLLNLKMGYRKVFFGKLDLDLFVGINNLLNEKYASMYLINAPAFGGSPPRYYYPGLPVNYFGGISLGFDF
jgi:iron complex outermembrane receptor protein